MLLLMFSRVLYQFHIPFFHLRGFDKLRIQLGCEIEISRVSQKRTHKIAHTRYSTLTQLLKLYLPSGDDVSCYRTLHIPLSLSPGQSDGPRGESSHHWPAWWIRHICKEAKNPWLQKILDKAKASSFSSLQLYGEGKCNAVGVTQWLTKTRSTIPFFPTLTSAQHLSQIRHRIMF